MGVRREGREAAIQFLYQRDLNAEGSRDAYYKMRGISPSARRFCDELLNGINMYSAEIDAFVARFTDNYDFERISAVDRSVIRLATYEMLHCPNVPPAVSIDEAIEVAKKYSTDQSGRFVNGVLDKIRQEIRKKTPPADSSLPPSSPNE